MTTRKTEKVSTDADGLPYVVGHKGLDEHPDPVTTIETLTPEIAEEWLHLDHHNRQIRNSLHERYARDMATARWLLTGDAIRFDWNGTVIDGQHRLWASVDSQKSFRTFVIRGLDPDVFKVIDSGAKRTIGDVIGLEGHANSVMGAAVARRICYYRLTGEGGALCGGGIGSSPAKKRAGSPPSGQEILAVYHRYREAITESISRAKRSGDSVQLLPLGVAAFLHFAFAERDRQMANAFFAELSTEEAPRGTPVFVLIRSLREWRRRRVNSPRLLGDATIRVWNAVREKRSVAKLPLMNRFDPKTGITKIV